MTEQGESPDRSGAGPAVNNADSAPQECYRQDISPLVLASYDAAQSGITRHYADITSTRNWLVTGLVVYYGTIVTQISYRWEQNIPPVIVILLAMAFTVYERGNAQILKMYCQAVENGSTPLTLEIWLQRNGMSCCRKLCFYLAVWWKKPFYWLWMLLLEAVVIGFLLATRGA